MAAYAALVSLAYIIEQIKHHPRPPISLDQKQVESLTKKVTFLQDFLEGHSPVSSYSKLEAADGLESRIADAAYAAEDVIESHIVDQILAKSTTHGEEISSVDFYQSLQKVIEDMDLVKKEVVEIKEKMGFQDQLQKNSASAGSLSQSSSTGQNIYTMVGCDDVLLEIMDKLTGGQSHRQIISIAGMGGIGKTTLARNIYQNRAIVQHFDILVWATISQEYRMGEILLELLQEGRGNLSQMDEYDQLGEKLHKKLLRRRYLIIMDDIWDIEVWDHLKFFFPDNNNGSRVMITTRLSNLASQVADSRGRIDMAFLDEVNSWNLFSKIVFGEEGCPLDWEEIGKRIVRNCRGLPLSIVVIGGFLAKSKPSREYWEYIEENLNSIVNSEDAERCLKILYMSYNQLPVYLKPCFLYMGVFREDRVIRVSMLIRLWLSEGFLKPISGKTLEEIALEYLKELVNRNLILVARLGLTGSIKDCIIHDLVRDLCLREAYRERFYNVTRQHILNISQDINTQRRIVIPKSTSEEKVLDALNSVPLARSLICDIEKVLPSLNFRLLRILKTFDEYYMRHVSSYFLENIFHLFVNSRYLTIKAPLGSEFPSSICRLWNLHTLIVDTHPDQGNFIAPAEIWNMPLLRHVRFDQGLYLPDPPSGNVEIFLENLQALSKVLNFKWSEEVVKRIPNIKDLTIWYEELKERYPYCLNNLVHLRKLKCLICYSSPSPTPSGTDFLQNLTFPHSLQKLVIGGPHVHWEDMLEKIGLLPLLEKLTLTEGVFNERTWETVEGQFDRLKFLGISSCSNLEYWMTESSHFPCLEHLYLETLKELQEIPSAIGEIPTLQTIEMEDCSDSSIFSAKEILQEQEELGEVGFRVQVIISWWNEAVERLASANFHVECWFD